MVAWDMFFDAKWEMNSSRAASVAGKTWIPKVLQKDVKLCVPTEYVRPVAGASPSARYW